MSEIIAPPMTVDTMSDASLHRHHAQILDSLNAATIARSHFEREELRLSALETSIRAEFDRRFFANNPNEPRMSSDDPASGTTPRVLQLRSGSPTMLQDEFARFEALQAVRDQS